MIVARIIASPASDWRGEANHYRGVSGYRFRYAPLAAKGLDDPSQ